VWELAVEGLSHGQSPLRIQRPPCPIYTPNNTPHAALAILLRFLLQYPRRETTRRVHPPHASSTPTAHHHHRWQLLPFPHSTIALAADPPGPASERAYRVYVSASRMHQHRRMWVAARRTRCRCRGVRAEREGGVRELAVLRVARRHAQRGHRHTARSQGSVRAPPAPHRAFSLAHVARGRTPRADASLRVARHFARVKGRARCIYTAQQLTRAAHQP
jgi:hypothetical protein